jgi:hypothetical protein
MVCKVQTTLANSLQKFSGQAVSADIEATRAFTAEFKKIIEDNNFPPDLVFNVNETVLY